MWWCYQYRRPNAQAEFRYTGYTVNGAKTASTSLMLDVREAPFELDDRVFGLVFDAYSDPAESEHELMVTVNSRSTATEGKDFILPAATLRGHGTGFARTYSIDIPSDMIDEINGAVNQSTGAVTGEVIFLTLQFVDSNAAKFRVGQGGSQLDVLNFEIAIEDARSSVPPVVSTNYPDSNTLEVSKDIGAFDLEFALSNESGKNITIGHTVNSDASTALISDNYSISTSPTTISPGSTSGRIRITPTGTVNANDTITLDLALTNAFFSITCQHDPCRETRPNDGTIAGSSSATTNTETLVITFVNKPTISIETVASEVAQSDFVEFFVKVDPATHSSPITINLTEDGDAARSGTAHTSIDIPVGKSRSSLKQTFSTLGNYEVDLAATGLTEYLLHPSMKSIDVDIIDGTSLPAITLGNASAVTNTSSSFMIPVQNEAASQTGPLEIHYKVTETGSNTGFFDNSPLVDMVTIPDTTRMENITVSINRGRHSSW